MAIRPKGTGYQVDVTVKGVRAPRVSCDTYAEAMQIEARFKMHLTAGLPPEQLAPSTAQPTRADGGKTVGDLLDLTYRENWRGTKSESTSLRNGSFWAEELGYNLPLSDITPDRISEVVEGMVVKGNSGGTVNRKLAALGKMLTVGEQREWCRKFKLPRKKEYEGRLRYYSDDEVDSLIEFTSGDPEMRCLIVLAVETGMRQGELLALTRRDINARRGLIELGATKGNKRRSVPLTDTAKEILPGLMRDKMDHERLFPVRLSPYNVAKLVRLWKAKRGMPEGDEGCFHTLRHTTCSRLVQAGVPLIVVQQWMGHKVIQTTMKYAHLAPDSLDQALVALNEWRT